MKMIDGAGKSDALEIFQELSQELEGKTVSLNGMIHVIRDMGDVVFVVLTLLIPNERMAFMG